MSDYIYATNRPWALTAFAEQRNQLPGKWRVVTTPDDLVAAIENHKPRYIFFPHWSHIVPQSILDDVECVCFHMTDVPYGRGGSPLQNLIVRGHKETKLTALQMTEVLDAGPVYHKIPLTLDGTAEEIYLRGAYLALKLIADIVANEPKPTQQPQGKEVLFKRRNPAQSVLPEDGELTSVYDHIRMLDAPDYPHAFLHHGAFRLEFIDAHHRTKDYVDAHVRIMRSDITDATNNMSKKKND